MQELGNRVLLSKPPCSTAYRLPALALRAAQCESAAPLRSPVRPRCQQAAAALALCTPPRPPSNPRQGCATSAYGS